MEIREAAQRIFRVRGLIVLACLMAGLAAGYGVHKGLESTTYTSSARLVMSGSVPQDSGWAAALAGTVEGIVTSPDRISEALAQAGVSRDIVKFTKGVDTQSLSDSSILDLSVTDTNAGVATSVANTLANGAVATLNAQQQEPSDQLLGQVQGQINSVTAAIDAINARLAVMQPSSLAIPTLVAQRADLSQQLTALITKHADIEQQMAQSVGASVISSAALPLLPNPSRLPLDLILGGLAGLILGVALAVLMESLRPTLVGRDAIEQALGVPVLGIMPVTATASAEVMALNARLRQAAERARTATAVLWNGDDDLSDVAQRLQSAKPAGPRSASRPTLTVRAAIPGEVIHPRSGLVVVVPPRVPLHRIEEAEELCTGEGLFLLGAILRPRRPWRRERRRKEVKLEVAKKPQLQVEETGEPAPAALVS
jgi:capsular polysaccharide biosynthesis protein